MATRDFAETFADVLLPHLYREAGGDGRANVHLRPYHAAVLLTGSARPTKGDVRHVRDFLYALAGNRVSRFVVEVHATQPGSFLIRPRARDPATPLSGGSLPCDPSSSS